MSEGNMLYVIFVYMSISGQTGLYEAAGEWYPEWL